MYNILCIQVVPISVLIEITVTVLNAYLRVTVSRNLQWNIAF